MTLNEYIAVGGTLPTLTLNTIPNPNPITATYTFANLFADYYGDHTTFTPDKTVFENKLKAYAHVICPTVAGKINAVRDMLAAITTNTTTETLEGKTAPLGVMDDSTASIGGTIKVTSAAHTIDTVKGYQSDIQNNYFAALAEFAPLFVGVYDD